MGAWVEDIEAKANIIHEQLAAARVLAARHGGDIGTVSKPYLELLSRLYEDEFPFARTMDESDLVARFNGPAVETLNPSVSIVTHVFSDLRNEIRSIAKAIVGLAEDSRAKWPNELDPYLSGLARGSLVVGIKVPTTAEVAKGQQLAIEGVSNQVVTAIRDAVRSLSMVARHVEEDHVGEAIRDAFPDPAIRDAVMVSASRLAPTGRRGINEVSFFVSDQKPGEQKPLTTRSRLVLAQALSKPVKIKGHGEFEGTVREIDLDARRFEIRSVQNIGAIRCVYNSVFDKAARGLLDTRVKVLGNYETLPNLLPRLVEVESVNVVRDKEEQRNLDLGDEK